MSTRRALVSLFDKTDLGPLATGLAKHGIELISTGGTARAIEAAGVPVQQVSAVTGAAEYPEGLVKTLHPKIHFALLANRDDPEHQARLAADDIVPIDFVICNLYAFADKAEDPEADLEDLRHLIDIGGPTMIRAGAKNWPFVTVITSPRDYDELLSELDANDGAVTPTFRKRMAARAFAHTAAYDSLIDQTLSRRLAEEPVLSLRFGQGESLRYGENPHQSAFRFQDSAYGGPNIFSAEQLSGKSLSYNNLVDGSAALEAVLPFPAPTVSVIKHTNPCGLATGSDPESALVAAWAGDPVSAFGSVIAVNRPVTMGFMDFFKDKFIEMIIAPRFDDEAVTWAAAHKKSLRLLAYGDARLPEKRLVYKHLHGGMLVQDEDDALYSQWEVVTKQPFPDDKQKLAEFALTAVKYVKSNEIVIAREYAPGQFHILGIGAGQPNRVDAIRKLAVPKARENLTILLSKDETPPSEEAITRALGESVLASGAFFPFRDNIDNLADAGLTYVVQPGGSIRDEDIITACDERGVAMVLSGMRHFRH